MAVAALGMAAAASAGQAQAFGALAAVMPRRSEVPPPPRDREERKRRQRRFSSLPKRAVRALNRPYVAHERADNGDALCGRAADGMGGTHRFAELEPTMCNRCQRARVRIEQQKRGR